MAVAPVNSSTGQAILPDPGTLFYNGVTFSVLWKSRMSGKIVYDDARRAHKWVEYDLYVEGFVTPPDSTTADVILSQMRTLLAQPAGVLRYLGKGFGVFRMDELTVFDHAWGPQPTLLEFSPLGGGQGAFVRWQVTGRLSEVQSFNKLQNGFLNAGPVMQFGWDYDLRYDDNCYAHVRVTGVLEIPLTRSAVAARQVAQTVDSFRAIWLQMPVDLVNFRVTDRDFHTSKDKRVMAWTFAYEELPPMGLPPSCTDARGTMSVRNAATPIKGKNYQKLSFMTWQVSLRASYVVRGDQDRIAAYYAFYSLLWFRVAQAQFQNFPGLNNTNFSGAVAAALAGAVNPIGTAPAPPQGDNAKAIWQAIFSNQKQPTKKPFVILTDFGFDEGLYLDSKNITFHATWWLPTNWQSLLQASGFLRWTKGSAGKDTSNLWSQSMAAVMGALSWNGAILDPKADMIVDFGGGGPWGQT